MGLCALQKSVDEGVDYCRRKVQFLKEQIDKFGLLMRDKQSILTEIEGALGPDSAAHAELFPIRAQTLNA